MKCLVPVATAGPAPGPVEPPCAGRTKRFVKSQLANHRKLTGANVPGCANTSQVCFRKNEASFFPREKIPYAASPVLAQDGNGKKEGFAFFVVGRSRTVWSVPGIAALCSMHFGKSWGRCGGRPRCGGGGGFSGRSLRRTETPETGGFLPLNARGFFTFRRLKGLVRTGILHNPASITEMDSYLSRISKYVMHCRKLIHRGLKSIETQWVINSGTLACNRKV